MRKPISTTKPQVKAKKRNPRVARRNQPSFQGPTFIIGEGKINMHCETVADICPKTGRVRKGPWPALTFQNLPEAMPVGSDCSKHCKPFEQRDGMIIFKSAEAIKTLTERLMYCYSLGRDIAEKKRAKSAKRKPTKKAK